MTKFSATEAGLEGFRITRENPKAFVFWAVFSLAVSALSVVSSVTMPESARAALETVGPGSTPDGAVLIQALMVLTPLMLAGLAVQCIMAAAIYRIIFRHDDTRFGYLRLGMDEVRLMALTFIFVALAIVLLVAVELGAAIIIGLAMFGGGLIGKFVGMVTQIFVMGLLFYILVRLSLAPVATFVERRLVIFDSWRLTRGHFWRLLLAYALALCCMAAVLMLTLFIFVALLAVAFIATGGQLTDVGQIFNPDASSFGAYLTPGVIAYMVVGSFLTALYYAVIAAPGAVAYRYMHGDDAPEPSLSAPAENA